MYACTDPAARTFELCARRKRRGERASDRRPNDRARQGESNAESFVVFSSSAEQGCSALCPTNENMGSVPLRHRLACAVTVHCKRERERERQRDTQRHRQRETERDRETEKRERERAKDIDRDRDRDRNTIRDRETETETETETESAHFQRAAVGAADHIDRVDCQ